MGQMITMTAGQLREEFEAIPKELRDTNQDFSVRVWRGLSWLGRAEKAEDVDAKFIFLWISFNAIYGQLNEDGFSVPDRASWQAFLARVVKADTTSKLAEILWADQLNVLKLVEDRYIFRPFWLGSDDADVRLARDRRRILKEFANEGTVAIFQELFERLYVLRTQLLHGAATAGSRMNRGCVTIGTGLLAHIMPVMIKILLDAGPEAGWGDVCFPPTSS